MGGKRSSLFSKWVHTWDIGRRIYKDNRKIFVREIFRFIIYSRPSGSFSEPKGAREWEERLLLLYDTFVNVLKSNEEVVFKVSQHVLFFSNGLFTKPSNGKEASGET